MNNIHFRDTIKRYCACRFWKLDFQQHRRIQCGGCYNTKFVKKYIGIGKDGKIYCTTTANFSCEHYEQDLGQEAFYRSINSDSDCNMEIA